jgi:hypothetical protein
LRIEEIAICDRAGVSWLELQELPGWVVDGYVLDIKMHAEAERRKQKSEGS